MAEYRLHLIDDAGKIGCRKVFDAADDAAAIAAAYVIVERKQIYPAYEVWQLCRRVYSGNRS